jgi:hypothetical protein
MSDFMRERRRLLRSSVAWIMGGAAVAIARPAGAWEIQKTSPKSALGLSFSNHCCGPSDDHAALVSELQARLAQDPAAQSLSETCPLCGCPVTVTR